MAGLPGAGLVLTSFASFLQGLLPASRQAAFHRLPLPMRELSPASLPLSDLPAPPGLILANLPPPKFLLTLVCSCLL